METCQLLCSKMRNYEGQYDCLVYHKLPIDGVRVQMDSDNLIQLKDVKPKRTIHFISMNRDLLLLFTLDYFFHISIIQIFRQYQQHAINAKVSTWRCSHLHHSTIAKMKAFGNPRRHLTPPYSYSMLQPFCLEYPSSSPIHLCNITHF